MPTDTPDLSRARLEELLAFAALRAATNEGDPNEQ